MAHLVTGIFFDSKSAGDAVAELKEMGFTKDISIVAKDLKDDELKSHDIKKDVTDVAAGSAAIGAGMGALTALLVGAATITLPGIGGILLTGPLLAAAGAAGGALTGGLVGALVDAGLPEEKAKAYAHHIEKGEVFVSVSVSSEQEQEVSEVFIKHGVVDMDSIHEKTI
ncbi:MAG TPA: DUF1269 domain-containing protein [Candidatus Nitrosocosmicus sp.]|nr:DUF1269 domain-containing protein [Candidatus Nitrosocosmicus sp.]